MDGISILIILSDSRHNPMTNSLLEHLECEIPALAWRTALEPFLNLINEQAANVRGPVSEDDPEARKYGGPFTHEMNYFFKTTRLAISSLLHNTSKTAAKIFGHSKELCL
jgi:hypothetical protein